LAISGPLEKQKRFYIFLIFSYLYLSVFYSFWVYVGKDRENMNKKEKG